MNVIFEWKTKLITLLNPFKSNGTERNRFSFVVVLPQIIPLEMILWQE